MKVTLIDPLGHGCEAIEYAATPHSHAYNCPLMRHLALKAADSSVQTVLLDALLGRDAVALTLASDAVKANTSRVHDADVIAALTRVCGGVDANVTITLGVWLDNECSILGEDGSGVAWRDGLIMVQTSPTGELLFSDGSVAIRTQIPDTLAIAAKGRTLGEIVELRSMPATRRIASVTTGDGATVFKLAA